VGARAGKLVRCVAECSQVEKGEKGLFVVARWAIRGKIQSQGKIGSFGSWLSALGSKVGGPSNNGQQLSPSSADVLIH
jgi:hypothetical protein